MKTITQYTINEADAAAAQMANSFSDYKQGAATAEYQAYLARFQGAAEKLIKRIGRTLTPEETAAVDYWADRYSKKLADAMNRNYRIEASCPSYLISGGGNFPVKKKQKQNAARDKFNEECGELFTPEDCYYFKKIQNLLLNKTIYSNDQLALVKLHQKLEQEEAAHAEAVKRNAYYRKHKTMKGYEGVSDEEAAKIDAQIEKAYSWEKCPAPAWWLANSNARIKQIKQRIAEIEKIKTEAAEPTADEFPSVEGVEVKKNAELMRIQLIFDGKPDERTRELLKSNGFKWAPSQGAWQRQLNHNGIYAAKSVLHKLSQTATGE